MQAAPAARGQMSKSQPVPGSGQESPVRPGQAVQCSVSDQRSAWTHVAHHAHTLRLSTYITTQSHYRELGGKHELINGQHRPHHRATAAQQTKLEPFAASPNVPAARFR